MNDLAEGERGATVAISCSCFIPDLHRILLSTLISLCWGVGGGMGVGLGSLIASVMRWCGVVMRATHFIFYWGDEISWLHRLYNTRCVQNREQDTGYSARTLHEDFTADWVCIWIADLALYPLDILNVFACLLLLVLGHLLFLP